MNIFTNILIKFIKGYKFIISPLLGQSCRYLPTCSEYSIEALKEFGLIKGSFMSIKRILSCHPIKFLGGGDGFDPVKKEMKAKDVLNKNIIFLKASDTLKEATQVMKKKNI